MTERVVRLAGAKDCEVAIISLEVGDVLTAELDAYGERLEFFTSGGSLVGWLTEKSAICEAVLDGEDVVEASVNSISEALSVRVRIVLGEIETAPLKSYRVGIVGEASYQQAIARCKAGDLAVILHEHGNPYDERALVVRVGSERIGYIARSSWLQDAVHDEGKSTVAMIQSIQLAEGGNQAVVLEVALRSGPVGSAAYQSAPPVLSLTGSVSPPTPEVVRQSEIPQMLDVERPSFFSRWFGKRAS